MGGKKQFKQLVPNTRVDANPYSKLLIGQVSDSESFNGTEEMEGHYRDFFCMPGAITYRQPTCHHICISYSFHLTQRPL